MKTNTNCTKCPKDLCGDNKDKRHKASVVNGKNFGIHPPCGISNGKYAIIFYQQNTYYFSTLEDCIDYLFLYKDLSLEDCLRLTRIKNELGRMQEVS